MISQRVRAGASRAENKLSNGPPRAHSKDFSEYHATWDARKASGYDCTRRVKKQGGTAIYRP